MHVLNAGQSSAYFDSLVDERDESAVSVIHGAWVEHTAPLGRLEHLEPASPLDMLILYQAAAATFRDWSPGASGHEMLAAGGRVVNREQARQRLLAVADQDLAALATHFANQVIALTDEAATEQDLGYYVELFLRSMEDKRVVEGILNGSISRRSRQLSDPDFW